METRNVWLLLASILSEIRSRQLTLLFHYKNGVFDIKIVMSTKRCIFKTIMLNVVIKILVKQLKRISFYKKIVYYYLIKNNHLQF